MHSLEHIIATFLRNDPEWKDQIIYRGPMGCLTGFYLIMKGNRNPKEIYDLLLRAFKSVEGVDEVPGALAVNCGNYRMHNIEMAKWHARKFANYLEANANNDDIFVYPKSERLVTEDGRQFFDSFGGVFARFANHPFRCKNEPELASAIDASYEKYYYKFYNKKAEQIKEYSEEDAKERAYLAEKYGFSDIQYSLFYRIREFTAEEYVELLGTYSDHIAIDEDVRTLFFKDIEDIINSMGGVIKIYDTMDLQLAKKVSG